MLLLAMSFLLFSQAAESPKATPAQIEREHQLLNGEWEIVSYKDDGETLGMGLLKNKIVKDGHIKISSRSFQVINPETNESRVTPFRVNPATLPKQISVTTRDDRVAGGIYRFEGDNLIVCLESFPDSGYPSDFEADAGSNRTLIKLKMVDPNAKIDSLPEIKAEPETLRTQTKIDDSPAAHTARATFATSRRPTESELTRVRELFAGNWDITEIVDDGEKLGADLIRRRFAEDGRVRFGTRSFAIVNPRNEERKISTYRLDPTKSPSEIDVTTQFDSVLKGIYVFEGDKLRLCVAKLEESPRPSKFEATGGSGQMLVTLKLSKDEKSIAPAAVASTPKPVPHPTAEEEARKFDAKVRRLIAGSWIMNDSKGALTIVFQPAGDFVATRTWARGSKRLFGPASDSSNGNWTYQDSRLSAWVSSTTDPRIVGHRISGRVQTVGDDTMVITDAFGYVKTFRRLR
jgi:uncharacterized protein (TIGR03067 family)